MAGILTLLAEAAEPTLGSVPEPKRWGALRQEVVLVRPPTITQLVELILAVSIIGAVVWLAVRGQQIPAYLATLAGVVLAYYFPRRSRR